MRECASDQFLILARSNLVSYRVRFAHLQKATVAESMKRKAKKSLYSINKVGENVETFYVSMFMRNKLHYLIIAQRHVVLTVKM